MPHGLFIVDRQQLAVRYYIFLKFNQPFVIGHVHSGGCRGRPRTTQDTFQRGIYLAATGRSPGAENVLIPQCDPSHESDPLITRSLCHYTLSQNPDSVFSVKHWKTLQEKFCSRFHQNEATCCWSTLISMRLRRLIFRVLYHTHSRGFSGGTRPF